MEAEPSRTEMAGVDRPRSASEKRRSDLEWRRWQKARIAELMDGVAVGDSEQAAELSLVVESHKRGSMAVKLYQEGVPPTAFAEFLRQAWTRSHGSVERAAGSRRQLVRLFEYAQFEIPDVLPAEVTVWRGTSGVPLIHAKRGFSWSTSRNVAAWFSVRFSHTFPCSTCLLLKTTVPKSQILFYSDDREEKEIVLIVPPSEVVVDGNFEDWQRWAACHA